MLLGLFSWLCYINSYMAYVLPAMLFTMSGRGMRIIILLSCTISVYDMITSLFRRLFWGVYVVLLSCPYIGHRLSEFVNSFPSPFASLFSFGSGMTAFENLEYPWDTQTSVFLVLCLLNTFQVLFRVKRLFKTTTRRSAPRLDSQGWHGMWESMGRYLENYSPPMVWDFTPEQLQDPDKVVEYLKGKCCGYSREAQLTALCWALASIYQALLRIMQHPQREEMETRPAKPRQATKQEFWHKRT